MYICGTDEYGTATETKAIEEGVTPQVYMHEREQHWNDNNVVFLMLGNLSEVLWYPSIYLWLVQHKVWSLW